MNQTIYPDRARVDARDKVRGVTRFAADMPMQRVAHAMTVPSRIVRGRLAAVDIDAARAVDGVLAVLTWRDFKGVKSAGYLMGGGFGFQSHQPMLSDRLVHRGEPIALVVAETLEIAIEAAALVEASYEEEQFAALLGDTRAEVLAPQPGHDMGDAQAVLASATFRVDAEYLSPAQFQNPMEMIATVAEWRDGTLTIHEGTQNSGALKFGMAAALGLDPARVRVESAYLGGGFGQKNSLQGQTVLAARAAMLLGRPVKLVMPRAQLFHTASFRPASRHRIRLGADADGRIVAASYDADMQNSRPDTFRASFSEITARLYAIPNYTSTARLVRTDVQSPGYMRAPFEHPAAFAFESAVDELAYAAGRDPLAFRLANDAETDPVTGHPFSSRFLAECLRDGAERFGWSRRDPAPGSMRAADGTLIGWGVAAGAYKAAMAPAIARLRVRADGTTRISLSGHEMGQGIRTAIFAAVTDGLAIDPARVEIVIGDPDAAPQHVTAGSWGTASSVPVVRRAVQAMQARFEEFRDGRPIRGTIHEMLARWRRPYIEVESRLQAPGQPDTVFDRLQRGLPAAAGPEYEPFVSFSYIAHFVEVRVEPTTRHVRVPRIVSVVDCGRIVSPRTAESQVRGGVVWGIGAALRETAEIDPRFGGVLNNDFAEYVVPVNADIGAIEVGFIDRPDPLLNEAGVKGLGEVAMVGVAAAIGNAIFHATGRRLRELPIRIEHLF
ncbi:xanthine dehydrogenase family protein molybdopterin-binding subunit [Rhizobium sp. LC145]|uniref:xanthine dehydrogenase family protein molybdopterin-binding subunit n=1 Tax=Rhizobium sp. LC145 TaxID=1120688 RepID=UPI00062A3F4F|nr:xanthine dehydrogenase family protein molybdopterin-binding subunit [Rhizobium sp. LC145]KKX30851.1 xanthine dehydrogenase [Rhizobium sp. LC145]TKT68566.1 xanthine dehydrogenase family protein molybdopterin-binding subunit [Rhizobiaceae bacterium LC148]